MWHYLLSFFGYTVLMIGLIYGVYFYMRASGTAPPPQQRQPGGPPLKIESTLDLEPRKRLYVVTYGQQRFLLSTTVDKTEFLTTLQEEPLPDPIPEGDSIMPSVCAPIAPIGGIKERFAASLRMVLSDRFPGLGGK